MSSPNNVPTFAVWTCLCGLLLAAPLSRAQGGALGADRSIPPTPTPVGSGARAAGMANAFIAIADDATAASWNPAGLVQLECPEISVVGSHLRLQDRLTASAVPEFDGVHDVDSWDLNYLSVAYPLPRPVFGSNVTISLNYQRKFDFVRTFDGRMNTATVAPLTPPILISQFSNLDFTQDGSLSTLTPAIAFELTHKLSLGIALNLWRDSFLSRNEWRQTTRTAGVTLLGASPVLSYGISREKYSDFSGENVTLGLLWKPNPRWSFGARYDSAFTGTTNYRAHDLELRLNLANAVVRPSINAMPTISRRSIKIPDTLALGAAYRANDRLTLALDVSRTDWNDLIAKDSGGRRFSLVDGTDLANALQRTHLDPAYTVRLGGEYVFIPREPGDDLPMLWSLRGGLFYEEEPATNRSTRNYFSRGDGDPDSFYGAALGVGLLIGQRVNLDLAYQVRYGPGVNHDMNPGADGYDDDELRHRVLLSTVIYF
ncbi:MAG: outer membrane protein transport protein [Candidatus Hydrogenedentes bacterium]|nr:outer membrane protein transport protein [Candidatus Hydrogenedentota bacterium]MBI3119765.1 outer membrane protein transport protein [Candidatus Hydrogenedentota bacterium]